jgi:hypothetical protein
MAIVRLADAGENFGSRVELATFRSGESDLRNVFVQKFHHLRKSFTFFLW